MLENGIAKKENPVTDHLTLQDKIFACDEAAVREHIKRCPEDLNVYDEQNYSPLDRALNVAPFSLVKLLIDSGADIHQRDEKFKMSALNIAIRISPDYEQKIMYLIDLGVDVNAQGISGYAPIHLALKLGNFKVLEAILGHPQFDPFVKINGKTILEFAEDQSRYISTEITGGWLSECLMAIEEQFEISRSIKGIKEVGGASKVKHKTVL